MKVSTVFIKQKRNKNETNLPDTPLILSISVILSGLISGMLIYSFMKESLSAELLKVFISFFYDSTSKTEPEFLSGLLVSILPYIVMMFIFALDLIGAPLALIFTYFKTLAPTLLFSFLYCEYGLKGAEYVFLVLAAGEITSLLGTLLICSSTYRMSARMKEIYKAGKGEYPQEIRKFIPKFTVGTVIVILSRLIIFITVTSFKDLFVF